MTISLQKKFALAAMLLTATLASAQVDVQLHYDLGRKTNPDSEANRQNVTATVEQFRPDRLGNIFYFIDLDFYSKGMKGAYIEFSREFNIGKKGLAIHGEYNGGLTTGHNAAWSSQFRHAFLCGPAYNGHSSDFRKTWSVQALFKQFFRGTNGAFAYPGWQVTGVWSLTFAQGDMFTFSGYLDFWRNHKGGNRYNVIIMGEPQLWFNLNALKGIRKTNLSVGTEWEVSNNLIFPTNGSTRTFFWNPTLALKWTMK